MKILISLVLCFMSYFTLAQESKTVQYSDVSVAFGSDQLSFSIDYFHLWKLGKKKRIEVGLGGRFTSYFGQSQYHTSAPASLADPIKTDSLFLESPQVNAINLAINIGYRISPKFDAGFNIDAIGFSFGKKQDALFYSDDTETSTTAKPTPFNLLLGGSKDQGSLNSEFYLRYFIKDNIAIKAAYQYLFIEYTTESKVQQLPESNDRFRGKARIFSIGITKQF
ncbi:MAG: hypothetical protein JXR07_14910 [Reichenbachiella sp.]